MVSKALAWTLMSLSSFSFPSLLCLPFLEPTRSYILTHVSLHTTFQALMSGMFLPSVGDCHDLQSLYKLISWKIFMIYRLCSNQLFTTTIISVRDFPQLVVFFTIGLLHNRVHFALFANQYSHYVCKINGNALWCFATFMFFI
jgi:hypothetical protein